MSTTPAASAWQISFSRVGRLAVQLDPKWRQGSYYDAEPGEGPHAGLALARMVAHITYRSDGVYEDRFGRDPLEALEAFALDQRFEVEGYLDYQGEKFVRRFDANSYLLLNKAMDLHDVGRGRGGVDRALARVQAPGAGALDEQRHAVPATPAGAAGRLADRGRRRVRLRRRGHSARPRRLPDRERDRGRPPGRVPRTSGEVRCLTAVVAFLATNGTPRRAESHAKRGRWAPEADMSDDGRDLEPESRLITGGRDDQGGALAPVVWSSTVFETETADEARAMAASVDPKRFYTRHGNPGVRAFESTVADLEGAEAARAFASGMGAVTGVVLGICSAGDHIVVQRQLYALSQLVFQAMCPRFGIEVTFVDGTEPGAFTEAVRPGQTTLVFAETPANPRLDLVDLEEIGAIAGPVTCVDSTLATPLAQRPLDYGCDLVLHSATKQLGGHNDATVGVVAGTQELIDWIWGFAILQGANASPQETANALRGMRTLGVRVPRQSDSAVQLAAAVEAEAGVSGVRHPGLPSHPQHDLARRQLAHPGPMFSFDLDAGVEAGQRFVEAVELARMATSFGGPETLVTHPASTTHANLMPDELEAAGIGPGTIRVSVGLEHPDDLVADFAQALDSARSDRA